MAERIPLMADDIPQTETSKDCNYVMRTLRMKMRMRTFEWNIKRFASFSAIAIQSDGIRMHLRRAREHILGFEWAIFNELPVACAASRSLAVVPGFVALTPNALTRTENRAPDFWRRSLIPLYSQAIAHGIAPSSVAGVTEPNIVRD